MNQFPTFNPNDPAAQQLTTTRLNLISGGQKSNQIQPGVGYRVTQTPGGTTVSAVRKRPPAQKFPPLWGTLEWDGDVAELYMEFGILTEWLQGTGNPLIHWDIANRPTRDTKIAVEMDDKVSIKVTVNTEWAVTAVEFHKSTAWETSTAPNYSDGDGYLYVRILEIIENPDHDGLWMVKHHRTGNIDYSSTGGFAHPWKVTFSDSTPASWDVVGDTVYTQGTPIAVADTNVVGDEGYVVLKITRDDSTREMTAAVVEFAATMPDSDYTDQYRALAKVDIAGTPKVIQLQFEEIRIFEDLAVVNGVFKQAGLEQSNRTIYDPPP